MHRGLVVGNSLLFLLPPSGLSTSVSSSRNIKKILQHSEPNVLTIQISRDKSYFLLFFSPTFFFCARSLSLLTSHSWSCLSWEKEWAHQEGHLSDHRSVTKEKWRGQEVQAPSTLSLCYLKFGGFGQFLKVFNEISLRRIRQCSYSRYIICFRSLIVCICHFKSFLWRPPILRCGFNNAFSTLILED